MMKPHFSSFFNQINYVWLIRRALNRWNDIPMSTGELLSLQKPPALMSIVRCLYPCIREIHAFLCLEALSGGICTWKRFTALHPCRWWPHDPRSYYCDVAQRQVHSLQRGCIHCGSPPKRLRIMDSPTFLILFIIRFILTLSQGFFIYWLPVTNTLALEM